MSELLRLIIERLPRVLKEGIQLKNDSIEENAKRYTLISNPTKGFLEAAVQRNEGKMTLKSEVYGAYAKFCYAKDLKPESEQSFSRKMTMQYGFEYKQVTNKEGERDYYWI